jgi:hypothetical protein
MCKCKIIPIEIGKFSLEFISQCKTREIKIDFDSIMIKCRALTSTTNHAYIITQYANVLITL